MPNSASPHRAQIVYLDQNHWVGLAQGSVDQDSHRRPAFEAVLSAVQSGKILLPLTFSNISETKKIADQKRRSDLASVQAVLSDGIVFPIQKVSASPAASAASVVGLRH